MSEFGPRHFPSLGRSWSKINFREQREPGPRYYEHTQLDESFENVSTAPDDDAVTNGSSRPISTDSSTTIYDRPTDVVTNAIADVPASPTTNVDLATIAVIGKLQLSVLKLIVS